MRACMKQHPNPAATAHRCTHCAKAIGGLPTRIKRRGICSSLGELKRTVDCDSCTGRVSLKVYSCPVHGEAVVGQRVAGVAGACDSCHRWTPEPIGAPAFQEVEAPPATADESFKLVAPLGTGKVDGAGRRKPWEFKATAIIPHLNTLEYLKVVIALLRLQTQPPYFCIIDTGSPFKVCQQLESLRAEDLEIHYLRGNGYCHSSEPVTVALDLGFARANTPLLFLTHSDCFPRNRRALEWLSSQITQECPAVGWEMSERSWITNEWKGLLSHTFTMLDARVMRSIRATWHLGRCRDRMGLSQSYRADGWPDTETEFGRSLKDANITPKLLGQEINYERQITDWWDHARSLTGTKLYCAGVGQGAKTAGYAADALRDAVERIREWSL